MKATQELQRENSLFKLNSLDGVAQASCLSATDTDLACGKVPALKRCLDLFCLALAFPTLLPLMLGIAALIKIVSPGPVFFTQERIGFMGKRFRIFKFRSMRVNAETNSHQNHLKTMIASETPMTK